ncbi:MAG: DNA-processing protein DprA, partial [Candidatus Margulisiibacteriota bacterium]
THQQSDLLLSAFYAPADIQRQLRSALVSGRDLSAYLYLTHDYTKFIQESRQYCMDHFVEILSYLDERYPSRLREIPDFPFILYAKGNLKLLEKDSMMGMVGTRKATLYYTQFATDLSRELANYNFVVVSGLAEGIDAAAHRGAMESGLTIAVLGHGIDRVYPASHRKLYKEIEAHGLLVTEFPPLHPADRWTFPLRNRIIAGLSVGVVVVESATSGGSLITADQALSYNREVFAVPGRPTDEFSAGPNLLIQKGAKLVRSIQDILDELTWLTPPSKLLPSEPHYVLSVQELEVLKHIGPEPIHIDTLQSKLSIPASQLMSSLSFLLLQNLIRELSGKYFVKK